MRRRSRRGRRRPQRHERGERGYNMVVLMVLVTVLNVLVAAALPAWSGVIQREKEEELIFRGLQYAEAIRVFQQRFGRLPNRLEELVEVEPRSIRRLWEDPMTGEARWGLIFAGAGAPIPGQQGQPGQPGQPGQQGQDVGGGGGFDDDELDGQPITNDPDNPTQGPISGVHSIADGESMLEFQGKQRYDEWHFTVDGLQQVINFRAAGGGPNAIPGVGFGGSGGPRVPDLSSRWIGRPWPDELEQTMQPGGMPGGAGVAPGEMPGGGAGQPGAQPSRRR